MDWVPDTTVEPIRNQVTADDAEGADKDIQAG